MRLTHREFPDYGWSVPVGADVAHYIQGAKLVGRAGWLGRSACNVRTGGNVPLTSSPRGRVCEFCANKTNYVRK